MWMVGARGGGHGHVAVEAEEKAFDIVGGRRF